MGLLSNYQRDGNQAPNRHWTVISTMPKLHKSPTDWTFILEPNLRLTTRFLSHVSELIATATDEPKIITNKLKDRTTTIIHHYAGWDDATSHRKLFVDFARGMLITSKMVKELANQVQSNQWKADFHIDAQHELAELADKVLDAKREWLVHDPVFAKNVLHTFKDFADAEKVKTTKLYPLTDDDVFFAVKTAEHLHKDRLTVVAKTWGLHFRHLECFSNVTTTFKGMKVTNSYGVPNTKGGHCGKTAAIIKNFDADRFKWLVVLDDDTLIGKQEIFQLLSQYDPSLPIHIGERYGFQLASYGYNYITGGGGMVYSAKATEIYRDNCNCPAIDSPDDMMISSCLERSGVHIAHEPAFHQARPDDYTEEYIKAHDAVSFHKHWNLDPIATWNTHFGRTNPHLSSRDEL